jgi:hypothetical protein
MIASHQSWPNSPSKCSWNLEMDRLDEIRRTKEHRLREEAEEEHDLFVAASEEDEEDDDEDIALELMA